MDEEGRKWRKRVEKEVKGKEWGKREGNEGMLA